MLQQTIQNLIYDISLIQQYIKTSQESGFNDMTRILESISIKVFNATHKLNLINKNQLNPNFPAIDLADDVKKIAIQVTTNADAKKIKHTVKQFEKFKLNNQYQELYIFGFLKCTNFKDYPSYCKVIKVSDLISLITDMNDEEIVQEIIDIVQQHSDFSRIHPYDDLDCLKIILNYIDRNAIKHKIYCEGSYSNMIKGLNEISELIGKGTVNKKTKSKSIDDFGDNNIKKFLQNIKNELGKITAILNQSRQQEGDFVYIEDTNFHKIDDIKLNIIKLSNEISDKYKCDLHIEPI